MRANRDAWLDLLWELEGGFGNNPNDNGGPTKYGVTQATLAGWRGKPVTIADVQALTKEEARDIALAGYWNAVKGDELPGGLDLAVADFAYNSGPARAAKVLQATVGVEADGYVGPKTLEGCRAADCTVLLTQYNLNRIAFLRSLDDWQHFGNGWLARLRRVEPAAQKLVKATAIEAGVPGAAARYAGVAAVVAVVVEALPALITTGQDAHDAVLAGSWVAVATVFAGAVGAVLGAVIKLRRWQAVKP